MPGVDPETGAVVLQIGVEEFFSSDPVNDVSNNNYIFNHQAVMAELDDDKQPNWDDFVKDFSYPIKTVDPASLKGLRKENANLSIWNLDLGNWCGLGPFPWPDPWDFFGAGGQFDADFVGEFNFDYGALAFRWFTFGPPCPLPPVAVGPPPFKNDAWADLERLFAEDPANQKKFKDERKNLPPDQVGDYVATSGYIRDLKLEVPSTTTLWKMYDIVHNRLNTETLMQWVCKCFGDLELATVPWVDIDLELGGGGSLGASGGVSAAAGAGSKAAAAEQLALGGPGPAQSAFQAEKSAKIKQQMTAKFKECQDLIPGSPEKAKCLQEHEQLKSQYEKSLEPPKLVGGATNTSAFISSMKTGAKTIISSPGHGLGQNEALTTVGDNTLPQSPYPKNVSIVIQGVIGVTDAKGAPADNQINKSHAATITSANELTISLDTTGWNLPPAGGKMVLSAYYTPPTLSELKEMQPPPPEDTGVPQNQLEYDVTYDPDTGKWEEKPLFYVPTEDAHIKAMEEAQQFKNECEQKFKPGSAEYADCMQEYEVKKMQADELATAWNKVNSDPTINPEDYPVFYGNKKWSAAASAEGKETISASTPPDFPVPMAVAAEAQYQTKAEAGFDVKGGVGVSMKTITLADVCDFCLNWPSLDYRKPTYDLMAQIVSVLKMVLEALLVQFLISLLVALLDWLMQCPDFSCPDQVDPDLGRDVSQDFGGMPINKLLDATAFPNDADVNGIFANCNEEVASALEQYEEDLGRKFLEVVSVRLSSGEVVGAMSGAPTDKTVEVFLETIEDEFADTLGQHFTTTAQVEDLIQCLARSVGADALREAEAIITEKMRLPEICDAPPGQQMLNRYAGKCKNPEDIKKFFDREMNLDHHVFRELSNLLRDPEAMANLIPPIFSKPPEFDLETGKVVPGVEGLMKTIDVKPEIVSTVNDLASSNLINPVMFSLALDSSKFRNSFVEEDPVQKRPSLSFGTMFMTLFGIDPDPLFYKWEPGDDIWEGNKATFLDYIDALPTLPPDVPNNKVGTALTVRDPNTDDGNPFSWYARSERIKYPRVLPALHDALTNFTKDIDGVQVFSRQSPFVYRAIAFEREPQINEAMSAFSDTDVIVGFKTVPVESDSGISYIEYRLNPPSEPGEIKDTTMIKLVINESSDLFSLGNFGMSDAPSNESISFSPYADDPFYWDKNPDIYEYLLNNLAINPVERPAKVEAFIKILLSNFPKTKVKPTEPEKASNTVYGNKFAGGGPVKTGIAQAAQQDTMVQFQSAALDQFLYNFYDLMVESMFGQVALAMSTSNLWISDNYVLPPKTMGKALEFKHRLQFLPGAEAYGHMPNWHHALYTRTSPAYIRDSKMRMSKKYGVQYFEQVRLLSNPLVSADLIDVAYDPEDSDKESMINPDRFKKIVKENYDWSEEDDPNDKNKHSSWQRSSLWAVIDANIQLVAKEVILRSTPFISQFGMPQSFVPSEVMIDLIYGKLVNAIKSEGHQYYADFNKAAHMVFFNRVLNNKLADPPPYPITAEKALKYFIKESFAANAVSVQKMLRYTDKKYHFIEENKQSGMLRKEMFKIVADSPVPIEDILTYPEPIEPSPIAGESTGGFAYVAPGWFESEDKGDSGEIEFLKRGGFIYEPYVTYELNESPKLNLDLGSEEVLSDAQAEEILFDAHEALIFGWRDRIKKNYNFVGATGAYKSWQFELNKEEKNALSWRYIDFDKGKREDGKAPNDFILLEQQYDAAGKPIAPPANPYEIFFPTTFDEKFGGYVHTTDLFQGDTPGSAWGPAQLFAEDCSIWFLQHFYGVDLSQAVHEDYVSDWHYVYASMAKSADKYFNVNIKEWQPPDWQVEQGGLMPTEIPLVDYDDPSIWETIGDVLGAVVGTVLGAAVTVLTAGLATPAYMKALDSFIKDAPSSGPDWWDLRGKGHYWKGGLNSTVAGSDLNDNKLKNTWIDNGEYSPWYSEAIYPDEWFHPRSSWRFEWVTQAETQQVALDKYNATGELTPNHNKFYKDPKWHHYGVEWQKQQPGFPLTKAGIEAVSANPDLVAEFWFWYNSSIDWLLSKAKHTKDYGKKPEKFADSTQYLYGYDLNHFDSLEQFNYGAYTGPMETFFQWLEDRGKTDLLPSYNGIDIRGYDDSNLLLLPSRNYRGERLFLKPDPAVNDGVEIVGWHPPTNKYMSQKSVEGDEPGTSKIEWRTCWQKEGDLAIFKKVFVDGKETLQITEIPPDSPNFIVPGHDTGYVLMPTSFWSEEYAVEQMKDWPKANLPGFDPRVEQVLVHNPTLYAQERIDHPVPKDIVAKPYLSATDPLTNVVNILATQDDYTNIPEDGTFSEAGWEHCYWETVSLSFPPTDYRQMELCAGSQVAFIMTAAAQGGLDAIKIKVKEQIQQVLDKITKESLFEGNTVFSWPPPATGEANTHTCNITDFQKGIKQIWAKVPDEAKELFSSGKIRLKDLFKDIKFGMRVSFATTKHINEVGGIFNDVYIPNQEYFVDWYKKEMAGIMPVDVAGEWYMNFSLPVAIAKPISLKPDPNDAEMGSKTGKNYMNTSLWALLSPNLSPQNKKKEGVTDIDTGSKFAELWFDDFLPQLLVQLQQSDAHLAMTKFAVPRPADIANTMLLYNMLFFSDTSKNSFSDTRAALKNTFYSVYHGKDSKKQKATTGWSSKPKKLPTKF